MTNDYGTILTKTSRSPEIPKGEQLRCDMSVIMKPKLDDVLRYLDQKLRLLCYKVQECKI
jgi:hypothetical protein